MDNIESNIKHLKSWSNMFSTDSATRIVKGQLILIEQNKEIIKLLTRIMENTE